MRLGGSTFAVTLSLERRLTLKKRKYEGFRDLTDSRLYECHLYIISVTTTRTGLIEAYRAAKKNLSPFLVAQLVDVIRERQQQFLDLDMIAATNDK